MIIEISPIIFNQERASRRFQSGYTASGNLENGGIAIQSCRASFEHQGERQEIALACISQSCMETTDVFNQQEAALAPNILDRDVAALTPTPSSTKTKTLQHLLG